MNTNNFIHTIESTTNFTLRRVIERLREGLFDPFGVKILTQQDRLLKDHFDQGIQNLQNNEPAHLCICGSYGQGKSHSLTYIKELALKNGFVTSMINLDPREIPFHNFKEVYKALINQIRFPDTEMSFAKTWQHYVKREKGNGKKKMWDALNSIPENTPHYFKSILSAMANENISLTKREKKTKKHITFKPREFPYTLSNALHGKSIPVFKLRHALKYREVTFYKEHSLALKGWEPYYNMVHQMSLLFRNMGYKGWVLLFDEGESISQMRITARSKSYEILDRTFFPQIPNAFFYPIFAFTDDFFMQMNAEDYERMRKKKDMLVPSFEKNYAEEWQDLKVHRLSDLSQVAWTHLTEKLVLLHTNAYQWKPNGLDVQKEITRTLSDTKGQETRYRLKSLIEHLDVISQN